MLDPSYPESVADHRTSGEGAFQCVLSRSDRHAAWVRLSGDLDLAGASKLEQCLHQALSGARLVVVDLRRLTFMDSSAVHVIVNAHNRARRTERRLMLIRGSGQVTRLLQLTGLSDRLEIVDLDPRGFSERRSGQAA